LSSSLVLLHGFFLQSLNLLLLLFFDLLMDIIESFLMFGRKLLNSRPLNIVDINFARFRNTGHGSRFLLSVPSEVAKKYIGANLGPTHQNARTRSKRWHDAALMLRPIGYISQSSCRRTDRRRKKRMSPGKDPSGQTHVGLL
jgi:hypothetical protein